jgi:WD40 repeat protein
VVGFSSGLCRAISIEHDFEDLQEISQWQNSQHWISDIKFSSNKKLLATASHDHHIYLYSIEGTA